MLSIFLYSFTRVTFRDWHNHFFSFLVVYHVVLFVAFPFTSLNATRYHLMRCFPVKLSSLCVWSPANSGYATFCGIVQNKVAIWMFVSRIYVNINEFLCSFSQLLRASQMFSEFRCVAKLAVRNAVLEMLTHVLSNCWFMPSESVS